MGVIYRSEYLDLDAVVVAVAGAAGGALLGVAILAGLARLPVGAAAVAPTLHASVAGVAAVALAVARRPTAAAAAATRAVRFALREALRLAALRALWLWAAVATAWPRRRREVDTAA